MFVCIHAYMYTFKGKTEEEEAATKTTTRINALLNNQALQNFLITHPQLTRIVIGIGMSAATGALLMMLSASPEQALAWRPIKGQPMVD